MTIFTFKLRLGIILGTIFWMKGIKRYNQEQDWKQISTQKTRKITTNKSKEMQFKCTLKSKFTFPQRPYILHYLQHSSSRALNQQKKIRIKMIANWKKKNVGFCIRKFPFPTLCHYNFRYLVFPRNQTSLIQH
jgi:hypothetical protein